MEIGFKKKLFEILSNEKYGVCPAPMSADDAIQILTDYLLGEAFCKPKNEMRTEKQCSRVNRCRHFELNSVDVFDIEHEYKPGNTRRITKIKADKGDCGKQINLFEVMRFD